MSEDQKIIILGGVHGDDKLGVEVLTYFFKHSEVNFQLLLGNYQAIEKGVRFVDFDLLKAGVGDLTCTTSVEKCRAAELHEVLIQHSIAVDIHGSQEVAEDFAIFTSDDPIAYEVARYMGITRGVLIPKNNYLLDSVEHGITIVKKVEARLHPSKIEVSEVVTMLSKLSQYFTAERINLPLLTLYTSQTVDDNLIAYLIDNPEGENLKLLKIIQ